MKEEGRGGGSELGSDLDLDPDPWKILWIQIRLRQNDEDPLDPDLDPNSNSVSILLRYSNFKKLRGVHPTARLISVVCITPLSQPLQ